MSKRIALFGGVYVLLAVCALFVALASGRTQLLVISLLLCAAPGLLVLLTSAPRSYLAITGFVLGFAPFAAVPGTGFQAVVLLGAVVGVIALLNPADESRSRRSVVVLSFVVILLSAFSALATFSGTESVIAYVKWAVAASVTLSVVRMAPPLRAAIGRSYVLGACAGTALSLFMLVADRQGSLLERLTIFGYGSAGAVNVRTAVVDGSEVVRATGLYVDPNSAGLFLIFALGIAGVVYTGWMRVATMIVIAGGVVSTLSRSAIISMIVAAIVYVFVQKQSAGSRFAFTLLGAGALAAAMFYPPIAGRLLDSFDSGDVGANARVDALENYPVHMSGHWLFGRGWYLREFVDPVYGYNLNHVANTPLLVIYRAGIFTGLAFAALLIVAIVVVVRSMRAGNSGAAWIGGVLIGVTFVAFQLDFPVVTMPPLAMAFGLLLAFIGVLPPDRDTDPPPHDGEDAACVEPVTAADSAAAARIAAVLSRPPLTSTGPISATKDAVR